LVSASPEHYMMTPLYIIIAKDQRTLEEYLKVVHTWTLNVF